MFPNASGFISSPFTIFHTFFHSYCVYFLGTRTVKPILLGEMKSTSFSPSPYQKDKKCPGNEVGSFFSCKTFDIAP